LGVLRLDFITLFPEVILASTSSSILSRAEAKGLVKFRAVNPRDYTYDRNHKVDDTPYGGQPGMLIRAEPVALAVESVLEDTGAAVIVTDPAGRQFRQEDAARLSKFGQIVFLCGHYEGFDERVIARYATHAYSIGDYVLTNGEMPALVMADSVARLLPGVLGDEASLLADSYNGAMLSAPNFTRPEVWRGEPVPDVLKSGNHEAIADWRACESRKITSRLRPEMLARADITLPPPKRVRRTSE
jgi:tRNA (guanine37-N1)-methyltransferase